MFFSSLLDLSDMSGQISRPRIRSYPAVTNPVWHSAPTSSMISFIPYFREFLQMLAKKTSKNQITLPKAIADLFPDATYFDVRTEEGRIILVPMRPGRADEVRTKLEALGIREADVADAIKWARRK